MKEVIAKLQHLSEREKESNESIQSVRETVASTAAASDAQRLALALAAERRAEGDARARALADKESRQEADEARKLQLAAAIKGATGLDLSSFLGAGEGESSGFFSKLTEAALTVFGYYELAVFAFGDKVDDIVKGLRKQIARPFKAIGKFFKNIGKKFKSFKTTAFDKIGNFFKTFGSKVGNLFKAGGSVAKAGGIFSKVFGVIGKLGGVLGKIFVPLGIILGAFAGIFDAVKAFQNEEGSLGDKVIAGITGFFQGFIGFAIGGLLDLGKDLLAWLLGVFGVPEEKLEGMKNFSVTDFLKDTIGNIFEGIKAFFKSAFDGMFEGFYLTEGNIFQKILGGIMGLITGWANGLLEGYAKVIDGIASFFGADEFSFKDWLTETFTNIFNGIKEFFGTLIKVGKIYLRKNIMKIIKIVKFVRGFVTDIFDIVTNVFKTVIEKGKEIMRGVAQKIISIGDTIKSFARGFLPDPEQSGFFGLAGKLIAKTGIYEFLGEPNPETDTKPVDTSVIIPPTAAVGEALTQAGNMTNSTNVTVVNNSGGNVTNTTTSSQTNNSSTPSPPVLSGAALAM